MDWEAIIDYVGVPAIFKDIHSGGRQFASRVHDVDELIQRYDESGNRTTILQEIIRSDDHHHAFVTGLDNVMILHYSYANGAYLPGILAKDEGVGKKLAQDASQITQLSGYDVNMVEFVVQADKIFVINSTNPSPDIDHQIMTNEQFNWCVEKTAVLTIKRALRPLRQHTPFATSSEN